MSEPIRYRPALDDGSREPWMKEYEMGGYVEYADYARLKEEVQHQKAMLWALEAYTGTLAVDINPNPWGMRNPYRKKNGCYFDGKPIKEGGQP